MRKVTATRLAPSPTGALHLGNARTFLINYALARRNGWRVLMRMEDLDGPRVKPEAVRQGLEVCSWLGMTWETPIIYQSDRHGLYERALGQLIERGMAYPCRCTRKDIELAGGAPHDEDHITVYPGTCRPADPAEVPPPPDDGADIAWRVKVTDEPIRFTDAFAGEQEFVLSRTCGDFVIFRKQGLAAYQLAVVVDDAQAGVDAIVRGDDLLESAARQIYLRRLMGYQGEVQWTHLPLVLGPDGRRLAKRHGDTRLVSYRDAGVSAERVIGLVAGWCGMSDRPEEMDIETFVQRFDLAALPRDPVTFTAEDEAFLTGREDVS
jgi:glutamyl-tRNA synthetase